MDITELAEGLCRLCLKSTPSNDLTELYINNREHSVVSKVHKLVGKQVVSQNDGLPQEICLICVENVNHAYDFATRIVKNHEKLKYLTAPVDENTLTCSENKIVDEDSRDDGLNDVESFTQQEEILSNEEDCDMYIDTVIVKNDDAVIIKNEDAVIIKEEDAVIIKDEGAEEELSDQYENMAEEEGVDDVKSIAEITRPPELMNEKNEDDQHIMLYFDGDNYATTAIDNRSDCDTETVEIIDDDIDCEWSPSGYCGNRAMVGGNDDHIKNISATFALCSEDGKPCVDVDFDIYRSVDDDIEQIMAELDRRQDYQRVVECHDCRLAFLSDEEAYSHECLRDDNDDANAAEEIVIFDERDDGDGNNDRPPNDVRGRRVNNGGKLSISYECLLCKKSYRSRLAVALHLDDHERQQQTDANKSIVYFCVYCNGVLEDEESLNDHVRIVHKDEYYSSSGSSGHNDNGTSAGNKGKRVRNDGGDDAEEDEEEGEGEEDEEGEGETERYCDLMTTIGELHSEQCDICGKITSQMEQHKMFHQIQNLEYTKSARKESRRAWLACDECGKKVPNEVNLLFHKADHKGETRVRCVKCDFSATTVSEYAVHASTHTGEKSYVCNDCDKCFQTRSAITDHVQLHMDGMRYMCELCGKQFKTCRAHAQHKLLQHRRYLRCAKCNRGFTNADKLKSHSNVCLAMSNNGVDMRDNNRCINKSSSSGSSSHINEDGFNSSWSTGSVSHRKFYCSVCKSFVKSNSDITMLFHNAKHDGKEGVPCGVCDVMCKSVYTYKNHMLIHSQERPFACLQCGKSFRTKGCLVQHMLVHGDLYKYTCNYCGKKSKKLTTHINHVNIHTDTKPYSCPDCSRPFRQLSDMKKHRKTHVKLKYELQEDMPAPEFSTLTLIPISMEMKEELMNADNVLF